MGRLRPIILAALISISHQAYAQTPSNTLRGVSKIQILIEDMNQADSKCGLTREAIQAVVMYPLSSTKIQIDVLAPVTLYLNISTLYSDQDQLCFSNVQIDANSMQRVKFDFSGAVNFAKVNLWYTGSVLYTDKSGHARHVSDIIEGSIKKFVTDWNLDNR
jgi:hypothetical protein